MGNMMQHGKEDYLKDNYPNFYKQWYAFQILSICAFVHCIASHEHIHPIITCASSYVSILQHDVSLVLVQVCIICDVSVICLVH
jgi:hypothetical protein